MKDSEYSALQRVNDARDSCLFQNSNDKVANSKGEAVLVDLGSYQKKKNDVSTIMLFTMWCNCVNISHDLSWQCVGKTYHSSHRYPDIYIF